MGILDDLRTSVAPGAASHRVRDVAVGPYYTAVQTRSVGLAATELTAACCEAPRPDWMGHLLERSAADLLGFMGSGDDLERTLGLAALNSLVPAPPDAEGIDGAGLLLERGRDRRVVTVGHFPFTEPLRRVAAHLEVLELDPRPGDRPAADAAEVLATADVVGVTATTIVNGTFDELRPLFPAGAFVVMLGPSTPLSPVLFDHGVDVLAGTVVVDPDALFLSIAQGASRRQLGGLVHASLVRHARAVMAAGR
jgi:uncharacterized protein